MKNEKGDGSNYRKLEPSLFLVPFPYWGVPLFLGWFKWDLDLSDIIETQLDVRRARVD